VTFFTQSLVEQAALAWLESLGYSLKHGPDIAPGELASERRDYGHVVLEDRLRQALAALNPDLPTEALDDAFRKLTRPEGQTLEARNRALSPLGGIGSRLSIADQTAPSRADRRGSSTSRSPTPSKRCNQRIPHPRGLARRAAAHAHFRRAAGEGRGEVRGRRSMKAVIHPHAAARIAERGATEDEVLKTIAEGEQFPAKFGRTGFRRNFPCTGLWRGNAYANKQIEAYAVQEGADWIVITVIVKYF
jgi:hypothetical protein